MEGYVLDDTIHKVDFIKKDNTTKVYTYTLDETNLMTTIEISKLDIDGNFIIGCELELYEIDEKNNLKLIDTWTTNEKTHTIKGLKVDNKYLLKEKDSADGYVISKDIGFHIKNTIDIQKIEMTDKVVEITKVDIGGEEIEGAKLQVFDEENNLVDEWISSKEPHKVNNLEEGKNYTLHEEISADGYVKATDIKFNVTLDKETQKIEMIDKIVEITKESIGGEEIEGAKLQVFDEDNNLVDEWISGKEPHKVNNLEEGKNYILHEEICVNGYVKATDIEFSVTLEKETQKITMIDKIVTMTKVDIGGNEIEGAEMSVTNENGEVVDSWISAKEPHRVKGLEENKTYTLTEITCPYGFEQAESITFTVTEDKETQLIEMKDMPILSNIKIIKVDSETKEIIKSKFIFGLFADEQCTELIKEVESDKNEGTILFDNLRYNTFYIKELSAPKGYELSNDIIKLEINEEGVFANGVQLEGADKTYSFEFENVKIPEIQTGNETNYILLVSSIIISLLFITIGIVILKKKNN